VLNVLDIAAKRIEVSIRKCNVSSLGAITMDEDVRYLVNYGKNKIRGHAAKGSSILFSCEGLARLVDIANILNGGDADDVNEGDLRMLKREEALKYFALKLQ
jgi:hypothetical protein